MIDLKSSDSGQLRLEVAPSEVEVGNTYPILAMVTNILESDEGHALLELNHSIHAHIRITSAEKLEMLKARAFEPGIFIAKVIKTVPLIEIDCQTIVFGKSSSHSA
ncbi:hypothetical protein JNK13_10085 [bacterium]|nr:hypothetical protein [bacterium]